MAPGNIGFVDTVSPTPATPDDPVKPCAKLVEATGAVVPSTSIPIAESGAKRVSMSYCSGTAGWVASGRAVAAGGAYAYAASLDDDDEADALGAAAGVWADGASALEEAGAGSVVESSASGFSSRISDSFSLAIFHMNWTIRCDTYVSLFSLRARLTGTLASAPHLPHQLSGAQIGPAACDHGKSPTAAYSLIGKRVEMNQ